MGARGPLERRDVIELSEPTEAEIAQAPAAPAGLTAATRKRWTVFWTTPQCKLITPALLPTLERLFRYYDEWARVEREYRKGEFITVGSEGQDRINPLADRLMKLEQAILKLEDKLGLNPMAAARLGIAVAVNELTWQQVARGGRGSAPAGRAGAEDVIEAEVMELLELPE